MKQFEYDTTEVNAHDTVEEAKRYFNLLGSAGWEIMYAIPGSDKVRLWMKREKD